MDEAILELVLQGRIAAHCSSIRPHNLAFSVVRSPDIRRSQCGNSEAIVGEMGGSTNKVLLNGY